MDRFDKFSKVKVLIVGDVMIDKYLWGDVKRISPEAPVPVVRLRDTSLLAGGAANVAANVAGLGAYPYLVGVIGHDYEGSLFPQVLAAAGVSASCLVKMSSRQTTIKTRVVAHNQQIVRVDQETPAPLSPAEEQQVWGKIETVLDAISVVVVSDYNKGLVSENLVKRLITQADALNKPVIVDPKGRDYSKYRGAAVLTPNKLEVAEVSGLEINDDQSLNNVGQNLLNALKLKALLVTRGEEGMSLFETGKPPVHLSARARHVYDVTGAGDTVIATLATCVGAGESFFDAARVANVAAGLVVRELGTTAIKITELAKAFGEPSN